MNCIGGEHVVYVEDPERITVECACGANPRVQKPVLTGGHPRVLWSVQRETLHDGRRTKGVL